MIPMTDRDIRLISVASGHLPELAETPPWAENRHLLVARLRLVAVVLTHLPEPR